MSYNGTIELIDGIKPKGGNYPLVDDVHVYVSDSKNLHDKVSLLDKISTVTGIDESEIQETKKVLRQAEYRKKELFSLPNRKSYSSDPNYATAIYAVLPNHTYYVTGKSHRNVPEYSLGAFYDSANRYIGCFGSDAATSYTDFEVTTPANAETMVVITTNRTTNPIEAWHYVLRTGSALIDGMSDSVETIEDRVTEIEKSLDLKNSTAKGSALTPLSVDAGIYDFTHKSTYGTASNGYGHSTYSIAGNRVYFVTCAAATNLDFCGGGFFDADGMLLMTFCDDIANHTYEEVVITTPADAATMILNRNNGLASVNAYLGIVNSTDESSGTQQKAYNLDIADAMIREANKNAFKYAAFNKGMVTFVFDDLCSDLDSVASIFEEYGYPLVIAAIPDKLNNLATGLSATRGNFTAGMRMKEICDQVVANGGEIMTHNSVVVTADNQNDYEYMYDYFVNSKHTLTDAGYKVRGLIRAGGDGSVSQTNQIERWLIGNYDYSNIGTAENYSQDRESINQPVSTVKSLIQSAYNNHTWVKFMCHSYVYGDYFTGESVLREILSYCSTLGISVVTYAYVFDNYKSSVLEERIKALE